MTKIHAEYQIKGTGLRLYVTDSDGDFTAVTIGSSDQVLLGGNPPAFGASPTASVTLTDLTGTASRLLYTDSDGNGQELVFGSSDQFLAFNGSGTAPSARAPLSGTFGYIWLSAGAGKPPTTAGCATATSVNLATNNVEPTYLAFDQTTDEIAQWFFPMPLDWDGGAITAKFYWMANDTSTNAVVWTLGGRVNGDGDALDQSWGASQSVTDANNSTAYQLRISDESSAITLAGTGAAGELATVRVVRDADNGSDTLAADALLKGVLIKYTRS